MTKITKAQLETALVAEQARNAGLVQTIDTLNRQISALSADLAKVDLAANIEIVGGRVELLLLAKQLAASGTNCYVRSGVLFVAKTHAPIARVA